MEQSAAASRRTLFDASSRLWRVRLIQYLSLACLIGAVWGGWGIYATYGLNPADGYGGQLAPWAHRAAVAAFVVAMGLGFFAGMWVYGRCYVVRMDLDSSRQCLVLYLAGFVCRLSCEIPLADLEAASRHQNLPEPFRSLMWRMRVNAPWIAISAQDRRLPLIIDQKADFPEARTFGALVRKLEARAAGQSD